MTPATRLPRLSCTMIEEASRYLKGKIVHTPTAHSSPLSEMLSENCYLKMEMLQTTGSFKVRGALYYLSTLTDNEKAQGVVACSAGNHGLGVSYAAKQLGVRCVVHVPSSVDESKFNKMKKLGAEVIKSEFPGYDETLEWSIQQSKEHSLHPISAFDDVRIMAGNGGTLGSEILEEHPDMENVIFPVGGGGLGAGLAYYLKEKKPSIRLIGCQHIDSPALKMSLERGEAVTELPPIETIAGGIEGGIGKNSFAILQNKVDDVVLLTEQEIREGVKWLIKNHQLISEPSSVVTISAIISNKMPTLKGKVINLLSGSNVSFRTLKGIINDESLRS
ncbi:MAG: pyridoxal-phosphate dependent enzyme [Chlamydiota bacterium]